MAGTVAQSYVFGDKYHVVVFKFGFLLPRSEGCMYCIAAVFASQICGRQERVEAAIRSLKRREADSQREMQSESFCSGAMAASGRRAAAAVCFSVGASMNLNVSWGRL